MWCSAADTHLKLLDRVVSEARFLIGGVFESDIARCRSVVLLCMLDKIRCNPTHPLYSALLVYRVCQWGLHTVVWSHIRILMLLLAAEPRTTERLLIPLSVSVERSCRLCIRWCETGVFQEQGQCFFIGSALPICLLLFPYLFILSIC